MKTFKHFLKIEFKRLFNPIIIFTAVLFISLSMYFIQNGSNQYKDILDSKENFKRIEQSKVKKHVSHTVYAALGFRILHIPSPLSIFFYKSGAFSELSATLDVGERLNVTGTYKGRDMFREQRVMYADFFGLHTLFGSLMALVYGFLSLRYREYLKLLASLSGFRKIYNHISGARFLLLALYFTIVTAAGTGLAFINGIRFTGSDCLYIAAYLGLWLLTVLAMFSVGTWIGAMRSTAAGSTVLVVTWIFFFYISPLMVNQATDNSAAKMKSIYQLEKEKWDALMNFEKRATEKVGAFKPEKAKTPSEREMIESFMNREYKEMQAAEKEMEKEMRDNVNVYHWFSLISPGTFLSSVSGEMSSKGYGSLVEFYEHVQDVKDKFCQFYKEKKFYAEKEEEWVESFVKGEENIFYGTSRMPPNVLWGLVELLVFIFAFQLASYYSHKRVLARVEGEAARQWDPVPLSADRDPQAVWQIEQEGFSQSLYNHLSAGHDFLYLCRPEGLPGDIRAGDFLQLTAALQGVSLQVSDPFREKRFNQLNDLEKFKVLIQVTRLAEGAGKSHFLFHDLTHDMPIEAVVILKERLEELQGQGLWVKLLLRERLVSCKGSGKSYGIRKAPSWAEQVEELKKILDED